MSLRQQLATVRLAQARVRLARAEVAAPVDALAGRVQRYPLTSVGAAAGVGVALAQFEFHPLRVPGVGGLLSGGMLDLVAHGVRLLAESGLMPGADGADAAADDGAVPPDAP